MYTRINILFLFLLLISISTLAQNAPNQSAPVNGSTWDTTTPTLYWWYSTMSTETYTVQVSTSSTDFTTPGVVKVNTTVTSGVSASYAIPSSAGLFVGITYYWRVGVNGNFSSVWSFKPATGAMAAYYTLALSVPGGNGSITSNPSLVAYLNGTSIQISANPDPGFTFAGWGGDASGGSNPLTVTMNSNKNITATFSPLPSYTLTTTANGNGAITKNPNQTSYLSGSTVTITAVPDVGNEFTGWSGSASGTTNPLSVPMNADKNITANFHITNYGNILVAPPDGAVGVSQSSTLQWNSWPGAITYRVLLSLQSNFGTTLVDVTHPTNLTYSASGLLAQQLYYWKVIITTGTGSTEESSIWSFTTGGLLPLDKPVITPPTDGETGLGINPTSFAWNPVPNADTYDLEVSVSPVFASTVFLQPGLINTNFDATTLAAATTYYARVKALSGTYPASDWSETLSFVTGSTPLAFNLLTPAVTGILQPAGNVKFTWEESVGAVDYNLAVSNFTGPPFVELETTTTETTFTGALTPNNVYSWEVTASNAIGAVLSTNGPFTFSTADTFYVHPAGIDDPTTTGTEANPYRSIGYALANTPLGSVIKVFTGVYPEDIQLNIDRSVIGYGPSNPRVSSIAILFSNVHIRNLDVNNSTINSPNGVGIYGPPPGAGNPLECITISNVNVSPGSNFQDGLRCSFASGAVISNCDFSDNGRDGIRIEDSYDLDLDNIDCRENGFMGIFLINSRDIHFSNIDVIDSGRNNFAPGIAIDRTTDCSFTNVSSGNSGVLQTQSDGVSVFSASGLTFTDCLYNNNAVDGVNLEPMNIMAGGFPIIVDINFLGRNQFNNNGDFGLEAVGPSSSEFVAGITFSGNSTFLDNGLAQVLLGGDVSGVSIDGAEIIYTTPVSDGLVIVATPFPPIVAPKNISVHNTLFSGFAGNSAIFLDTDLDDVDARNNIFADATDIADIETYIWDVLDDPLSGDVITDGSSFGVNPEYVVESLDPTYVGASYLVDVDFYPKGGDYLSLTGIFSYDNTKLEYLGFLNDGLINANLWSVLSVTETITGPTSELAFSGWGLNPINISGKLFTLNMKVKSTADPVNSPANITGNTLDFAGLTTSGPPAAPFDITDGGIKFFATTSPIQAEGDVNLDGIVDIDDFNILLLYVFGTTSAITDPQALDNADYDGDGDIDNDDLTALFNFINGIIPPAAPIIAGGLMDFQQLQFIQDNKSISIPILLKDVERLNSFEIELKYDPVLISYQAFKTELTSDSFHALGYEVEPGLAQYVVYCKESMNGTINPGELILRFIETTIPEEAEILTRYKFNGREFIDGPVITISNGSITDVEDKLIPDAFEVSQNYPNPFNPTTTIRFGVADPGFVSIKVFNMLGEEVKSIINNEFNVGFHQVNWNGDDNFGTKVSSGTDIYRVINGSNVVTKKMLLLK